MTEIKTITAPTLLACWYGPPFGRAWEALRVSAAEIMEIRTRRSSISSLLAERAAEHAALVDLLRTGSAIESDLVAAAGSSSKGTVNKRMSVMRALGLVVATYELRPVTCRDGSTRNHRVVRWSLSATCPDAEGVRDVVRRALRRAERRGRRKAAVTIRAARAVEVAESAPVVVEAPTRDAFTESVLDAWVAFTSEVQS
jgi:hypothetical protein